MYTYKFMCRSYALTRPKSLWLLRTFTNTCVLPLTALYKTEKGPDFKSVVCSGCSGCWPLMMMRWIYGRQNRICYNVLSVVGRPRLFAQQIHYVGATNLLNRYLCPSCGVLSGAMWHVDVDRSHSRCLSVWRKLVSPVWWVVSRKMRPFSS
jgi:hypothetical protein